MMQAQRDEIRAPDASMEFFEAVWAMRGKLLTADSPHAAQSEADLICRILFARFLNQAGFFGAPGFAFAALAAPLPDFSALDSLHRQLGLNPAPSPRLIHHPTMRELVNDILPAFSFPLDAHAEISQTKPSVKTWMLGYVYERWIDNRKTGSYFTADALAYSLVTHALKQWLQVQAHNQFGREASLRVILDAWETRAPLATNEARETAEWLEHTLAVVRVIDPSMGGGAFLVAALQTLGELRTLCHSVLSPTLDRVALVKEILARNLHGVDILPTAIHIAKLRVWLASAAMTGARRIADLGELPKLVPGDALVALDAAHENRQSAFLNIAEPTALQAFLTQQGGFDLCVGNPPFIALSQRNHVEEKRAFIQNWNARHPHYELRTTSDVSNFFILRGVELLRPNGVLAYITSRNFFDTRYGEPLRRFLSEQVELRYLYTLHDHPFTQLGLKVKANTVILSLMRRAPQTPVRFQDLIAWHETLSDDGARIINRDELARSANWTQTLFQDPLRSELEQRCPKKIRDYTNARMGIKSGDNDFFRLRSDSELFAELARESLPDLFIKIVRNSREIPGFVLPAATPYRLLNLRETVPQVERGFGTKRLAGIAQYIHQHGVAYACPQCHRLAQAENERHPERYPHRGMCAQCSECRARVNPCDRPVDRSSNQGHRPEWYTLSINQPPAIAVQCIVDTEIGIFWNRARVYATDQFQTIDDCADAETTRLVYLFLCSRVARYLLEGQAMHRARFDGSFMLKIQVNHLHNLPCPDFERIHSTLKRRLLALFELLICVEDRRTAQAQQLLDELDRLILESLGYPREAIDAVQNQLATQLEQAILFRWTKTRARNQHTEGDQEHHGTDVGENSHIDPGVPAIQTFDSDQEPTGAAGQQ